MRKESIFTLKDTRPEPTWSFPLKAVANALSCHPTDPVMTTVQEGVLVALARFRKYEHWHDRVSLVQRVRALGVIHQALATALEQYSQLDSYTESWLSNDNFRFAQRLHDLRQDLDRTVTGLAGPGTTAAQSWAIASRSDRRRPPRRARDLLVVNLSTLFERTARIPRESFLFKQHQHAFVLSILKTNRIPCPQDYDAFVRIRKGLPIANLSASFIQQERDD